MRCLLLSSLVWMMWCGCSPKVAPTGDFKEKLSHKLITIFHDTTGAYLYKNKIELYGHYLSGLMMIKPQGNGNYKVAMTTEFGAKIMDFEITDGRFIMHDMIEQMRRKRILKMIEADMKLLFGIQSGKGVISDLSEGKKLVVYNSKPLKGYYTIDADGHVMAINGYRKKKKFVESTISDYEDGVPHTLKVTHVSMPVQIEMNLIKAPGYAPE